MMISFKPSGYSREEMISAVEAMGYPYAFSGLKRLWSGTSLFPLLFLFLPVVDACRL